MSYPTDKELEGKYLDESSLTTIKHLAIPTTTEEKNKCYQDFDITWPYIGGYQRLSQYASELGLYNIVAYVNLSFENVNDYQSIGMKHVRNIQRTKWWLRNDEMISDASRRQMKLSQNDMVFKGYKYAYDCGVAVYEYVE